MSSVDANNNPQHWSGHKHCDRTIKLIKSTILRMEINPLTWLRTQNHTKTRPESSKMKFSERIQQLCRHDWETLEQHLASGWCRSVEKDHKIGKTKRHTQPKSSYQTDQTTSEPDTKYETTLGTHMTLSKNPSRKPSKVERSGCPILLFSESEER